jgi:hypothetical protein
VRRHAGISIESLFSGHDKLDNVETVFVLRHPQLLCI